MCSLPAKTKKIIFLTPVTINGFTGIDDGKYPEVEKELVKYVQETRKTCCAPTQKKCLFLCGDLEIARSLNKFLIEFEASRGWFVIYKYFFLF